MTIELSRLKNGLQIATDRIETVDTVSLGVWVDIGTRHERQRHILLQYFSIVCCTLARGIGVEVPADGLNLFGDRKRAPPLCALERHMFEEMSDAVDLGRLVAGANVYPDPKRDGRDPFQCGR